MHKIGNTTLSKIIVIGGGSFQGKSLIALHIANKCKIPLIICTDTIRNILHTLYPDSPNYFTSTYLMSPENLYTQMVKVSNILEELLPLYIKRGENVIIEGMHLSSDFIANLPNKPNVLAFCIDNKLPLKKRIELKSLTRRRIEYIEPKTGEIKYGQITRNSLNYTPYIKYANRIEKIHQEIIGYFHQANLNTVNIEDFNKSIRSIEKKIDDFYNEI